MFGNRKTRIKETKLDTMVGPNTEINGNIKFSGFLVVNGRVNGNVSADENTSARLSLYQGGRIVGDVSVPELYIDGEVEGDVYASERVELANNAQVNGNVYYNLLEMAMGAAINGNLVHKPKAEIRLLEHKAEQSESAAAAVDSEPKKKDARS